MGPTPVKLSFRATISRAGAEPVTVSVIGRTAWAILSLMRAGKRGCTPIDRPAPRWSDYVFKARGIGFNIETVHEGHEGSFAGHHARYVLHDAVTVSGGTLTDYLASPEGRREFPDASFARAA
ncbi:MULTISPECIES: hypothetical protein [unclassified Devosia]|uniref:winged helix domain-containing protein n=1 Tax=unclassified Devosia TaxID=196773 RepID=UPI00086D0197|nr:MULTISPECIES: hypothetical protein [unclassified Devosia]MBN9365388.1 hypothetical protein [Devosia sp.]ODS85104.1 MAG: hypothetical protein ABS47_17700 [Devosia sp. SCN 66-27]OJX20322.1 MAG: hypothetical protein BGO83_04850 [Devosia sp. 66-14]